MQAVILCGGKGVRLRPLTSKVPKPIVPINGRPFLEHQILYLKKHGIKDFVFCAGYLWEKIKEYFNDGSRFGVKISYSIEHSLLGTGGALKNAKNLLWKKFFVIYGDSYLPINYKKVYEKAEELNKIGVLVVYNNEKDTHVKNNVVLNKDGLVTRYDKEIIDRSMKYVDAGVSVFKKEVLNFIIQSKNVSLEKDVFKKLINAKQLAAIKTKQRFYDIGTAKRLKEIEKILV